MRNDVRADYVTSLVICLYNACVCARPVFGGEKRNVTDRGSGGGVLFGFPHVGRLLGKRCDSRASPRGGASGSPAPGHARLVPAFPCAAPRRIEISAEFAPRSEGKFFAGIALAVTQPTLIPLYPGKRKPSPGNPSSFPVNFFPEFCYSRARTPFCGTGRIWFLICKTFSPGIYRGDRVETVSAPKEADGSFADNYPLPVVEDEPESASLSGSQV